MLDLGDRSGLEDITNFSDVFEVSNRLGGNLKQVVSESYDMIRDKIDIELEINTIVASGRNELNIMAALPFLVVLMMKATSDSTATHLIKLSEKERIEEIARMLSGSSLTAAALDNARELLKRNDLKDGKK